MPFPILSVILPVYNEHRTILNVCQSIDQNVLSKVPDAEVLIVDDGSTDGTGTLLDEWASANTHYRIIHQLNAGHGAALRAGLNAASGQTFFLIDSDDQIPLEPFEHAWEKSKTCDLLSGVRQQRQDPIARLFLTKVIRFSIGLIFWVYLKDANCPFKLIRRDLWEAAKPFIPAETLAPSLFLAVFARRQNFRVVEFDIPHRERSHGTSSLRYGKLLRFCARAFQQLWRFRLVLP